MRLDANWNVYWYDSYWRVLHGDAKREAAASPALATAPCIGCPRTQRCAELQLACTALKQYLRRRPSHLAPRVDASHALFLELGLHRRKDLKWPPKR